ncbi:MAG: hypothetical protein ABSG61_14120 [Gemmatimonadales bacterium]|jgi:hypothetical protein
MPIVGVGNDPTKKAQVFNQAGAKACLLVFVTDTYQKVSGPAVTLMLNKFDADATAADKKTMIGYPIYALLEDANMKALWKEFDPDLYVPGFVFTYPDGSHTGIKYIGLPTPDELIDRLSLVVP